MDVSKSIVAVIFAVLTLIAVVLTVWIGFRDAVHTRVVIDKIAIINGPSKSTIDPESASRILLDAVLAFKNDVRTRKRLAEVGDHQPAIEIKVQDVSISGLIEEIKRQLGYSSPRLSGELLCGRDKCEDGELTLHFRYREHSGSRSECVGCKIKNKMFAAGVANCLGEDAAAIAWKLIDPFAYAVAKSDWSKDPAVLSLAEEAAYRLVADRRKIQDREGKAWAANLLCLTRRKFAEYLEQRKSLPGPWLYELTKSAEWCNAATRLHHKFAIAWTNWGDVLVDLGVAQRSTAVIGSNPDDLIKLNAHRDALSCYEAAVVAYQRAMSADPSYQRPTRRIGRVADQLERNNLSIMAIRRTGSRGFKAEEQLATEAARAGDIFDVSKLVHAPINKRVNPSIKQYRSLGGAAAKCLRRAREIIDPRRYPKKLCKNLDLSKAAILVYRRGIKKYPRYAEGYRSYGDHLVKRDYCETGIQIYRRAVLLDPREARYAAGLVRALRLAGRANASALECKEIRRLLNFGKPAPLRSIDCVADVVKLRPDLESYMHPRHD